MISLILWLIISIMVRTGNSAVDEKALEEKDDEMYYNLTYSDTSCLFTHEIDNFPSADASNFTLPEDSIFFIETSCRGGLDFRQACSVETAARAHPNKQINVLFAGRDSTKNETKQKFLNILLKYKNVKFFKVHIIDYAKGTPLEDVVIDDLRRSRFVLYHASDVMRFLTLYKFGGIYLDLDVFVVKSLDYLPVKGNWVGRDTDLGLAVGLMALTRNGLGKEIMDKIMTRLENKFDTYIWGGNGINVITEALEKVCSLKWKAISPATCKGFKIYEPRYFYPVISDTFESILGPINGTLNLTKVFAFHLWNYLIYDEKIDDESLHAVLSRKYCPHIDKIYYGQIRGNSSIPPTRHRRHIRTLRLERTRVDTLYNNIDINLKEKMLNRRTNTVLKKLKRQHHRLTSLERRKGPPDYHVNFYEPLHTFFNKTSGSIKIQWKQRPHFLGH